VLGLAALLVLGFRMPGCNDSPRTASVDPKPAAANAARTTQGTDPPPVPVAVPNVLTYHNDVMRTGQNLNETVLSPANVNSGSFGKVGFLKVQGKVDAEPLYVSNLNIAGKKHNVVFVVTEHDLAYAFDADTFAQLWRVSLLRPGETPSDKRDCEQIEPEIGITSTPVIDLKAGPHGTMYVVTMSKDSNDNYFHRLHALDLGTGSEKFSAPVTIAAQVPGTGDGSINGIVYFTSQLEH